MGDIGRAEGFSVLDVDVAATAQDRGGANKSGRRGGGPVSARGSFGGSGRRGGRDGGSRRRHTADQIIVSDECPETMKKIMKNSAETRKVR